MNSSNAMEIILLGTGTSHGVPMIGCHCDVCRSTDPRDRRYRSCCAIRLPNQHVILVDVPPEFRLAAVENDLNRVDAVLLTHAHADHIMGLDDLRRYNDLQNQALDCFGRNDTLATVRRCFAHTDRPFNKDGWPSMTYRPIDPAETFETCGSTVRPIPLLHGSQEILGFRLGNFAYCTDCSAIPEASRPLLDGLELLVLDGLRYTPHPTHFNIPAALDAIEKIRPKRALLTHIAHEIGHAKTSAELPDGVEIAYDGQRVTLSL